MTALPLFFGEVNMNSLDIIKQHIIKTLTFYNLSRKNKSLRAELGKIHSLADKLSENNSWISVDDELPINEGFVTLYTKCGDYLVGQYCFDTSPFIASTEFYQNQDYEYLCELSDVTHWQPLPQPPKE
ncbi:DUF551 domain-containing protein [Moraxella bovis]|uniref:DUF551 domain-containing protein n=1 Tax=Moraxella bovis TaxID=476 RepID=UPI002225E31C|nr:DUF551 domain-containing protein [Moraxella bovis]UYZ67620.1 DUF551 domain-containing protein [Moraxella bovis]UZA37109.1 DUF551 domain-containing protein [Moraxella bovis]